MVPGQPRQREPVPRGHRDVHRDGELDRRGEGTRRRGKQLFTLAPVPPSLPSVVSPLVTLPPLPAPLPPHRQGPQPRRHVERLWLRGHAREVEQQQGVCLVSGIKRRRSGGGGGGDGGARSRRRGRRGRRHLLRRRLLRRRRDRDRAAVAGQVRHGLEELAPVPRAQGGVRARGSSRETQRRREPGAARDERLAEPPEARDEPRPLWRRWRSWW